MSKKENLVKFIILFFPNQKHSNAKTEYVYLDKSDSPPPLALLSSPSSKLMFELDDHVSATELQSSSSSSSLGQDHYKAYLNLTNVSATRLIVFKIKTNLSVMVRASPSQATLKPNETLSIRFRLHKNRHENGAKDCGGKLVVKYVIWNDEEMASVPSGDEFFNTNWKSLSEMRMNYLKMDIDFKCPKSPTSEQKILSSSKSR